MNTRCGHGPLPRRSEPRLCTHDDSSRSSIRLPGEILIGAILFILSLARLSQDSGRDGMNRRLRHPGK
jgi:hypothetical protein